LDQIKLRGELRTDLDCEIANIPGDKYAEAVLTIGDEELAMEVSIEDKIMVALMAGDDAVFKGSLDGLKKLLRGEISAR